MTTPERLLAILITEAAFGYPARLTASIGHPVMWIGTLIARIDAGWNHAPHRRAKGVALLLILIALPAAAGLLIERLTDGWTVAILILIATTGLAQRSLHDHVAAVLKALQKSHSPHHQPFVSSVVETPRTAPASRPSTAAQPQPVLSVCLQAVEGLGTNEVYSDPLTPARTAVARIVGRDTAALDEAGIATAAIESLAESFCDGVVAPAFWFLIAGLPGLFVAKAINTADSMVGHRTPRHAAFGWASARADDGVNWIPARIAGALLCIAGHGGWRTMWRDAPAHASPNGGWPEAAMAGALHRTLGGPVTYDGEPAHRARLGHGPAPDAADLARALLLYRHACLLLWLIVGGIAWAL